MFAARTLSLAIAAFSIAVPSLAIVTDKAPPEDMASPAGQVAAVPAPVVPVTATGGEEITAATAILANAIGTIKQSYNGPVDVGTLTSAALKAMAGTLDGHSTYMTPQEFADFQTSATGAFAGIGTVIEVSAGKLRVVAPTDGGPAAKAGIGAGWEIISIDSKPASNLSLAEATRQLRGPEGTRVSATFRDNAGNLVPVELVREKIRLHSVYQRRIGTTGYIRISGFAQVTDAEFSEAQAALLGQGPITGLILDLRNNGGGFMDAAIAVVSRFLQPGQTVVRTGKSAATATATLAIDQGEAMRTVPMVVLVNNGSASAAEIVAAALQDNRRAPVLGLVTFGKGLVQTVFPLSEGRDGALSVTTLRYYTPTGRSIQRIGVTPDLLVARTAAEAEAAVQGMPEFSEAAVYKAPGNEMNLERFVPEKVEGPVKSVLSSATAPAKDITLFLHPVPTDEEISADFQIERALDMLNGPGPSSGRPAQLYLRGRSEETAQGRQNPPLAPGG